MDDSLPLGGGRHHFFPRRSQLSGRFSNLTDGPKTGSASVACIGKGKAHKPNEFGVKVSIATTLNRSQGAQFVVHSKALPGNPYVGHTLERAIPDIEKQVGANIKRISADKDYCGHNAPDEHNLRVYISGRKRGVTKAIKRDLRRRSAVEPVVGHAKSDHRIISSQR